MGGPNTACTVSLMGPMVHNATARDRDAYYIHEPHASSSSSSRRREPPSGALGAACLSVGRPVDERAGVRLRSRCRSASIWRKAALGTAATVWAALAATALGVATPEALGREAFNARPRSTYTGNLCSSGFKSLLKIAVSKETARMTMLFGL